MRWNPELLNVYVTKIQTFSESRRVKLLSIAILLLIAVFIYFGITAEWFSGNSPEQESNLDQKTPSRKFSLEETELSIFIDSVLSDTEDVWNKIFTEKGGRYLKPEVIKFSKQIDSVCGVSKTFTGSFYCPSLRQVFIDLSFYQDLRNQLDAPGNFSQAYVIAHMVGHHVQNLIGITSKAHLAQQQMSPGESSRVSVKLELQADCYAGIWAKHTGMDNSVVETDTINDALDAVSRLLLEQTDEGYTAQDAFNHSSSAKRARWFVNGLSKGTLEGCNTFAPNQ